MKPHTHKNHLLLIVFLLVSILNSASAEVLSLNFIRGSSGETVLGATDVAGQVPVANWNNATTLNVECRCRSDRDRAQ